MPADSRPHDSYDSRPRASDFDGRRRSSRSRSPPPHQRSRRDASPERDNRGDRRASPVYESYDRVESKRDEERRRDEDRRRSEREAYNRERDQRDADRERRGIERERRATPDRELGYGRGGGGGGGYQGGPPRGGGGGDDWFVQRRKERDNSSVNIWPPSPKAPTRDLSPEPGTKKSSSRKHKSSKSRRHRHDSVSTDSETDSDDDRRRSSKKHKSSSKHSSSRKHKSSKHRSSSRRDRDDEDLRDDRDRDDARRDETKAVAVRSPDVEDDEDEEDMWVEKPSAVIPDDGEEDIGPLPVLLPGQKLGRNAYGGALLKGEGSAMAAFVENGERIPRRGEIGMESTQIEKFEQMGYVMSGSRHRRMNAVRVRKENQVISAEEKRGILKMQAEEKAKRENQIVASFKEIVDQKLAGGR